MQTTHSTTASPARRAGGLTLLELLVAMGLLSVIILGLYAMFDRTQRAFIASVAQVDVHEGSRAAVSLVSRDVWQMQAASDAPGLNYNLYINDVISNYSSFLNPLYITNLDGTVITNRAEEFFFMTKSTNWIGIGYVFAPISTNRADMLLFSNGVGALLRYQIITNLGLVQSNMMYTNYLLTTSNEIGSVLAGGSGSNYFQLQRVAEGMVHFTVIPYFRTTNGTYLSNDCSISFSNTLPAFVELEMGFLEPQMVEQARGIVNVSVQRKFLTDTNRIGHYHLFRQQVTVPAAN